MSFPYTLGPLMSLPKDFYYIGIDLANIQAIKTLCQHITLKESPLQQYRSAILNLAQLAEKECYEIIKLKQDE